jgi:hypothetical protein
MSYYMNKLLNLKQDQLDELFMHGIPADIPNGPAKGTAIIYPGSAATGIVTEVIKLFVWEGKVFDAKRGVLINKITPPGINATTATVYEGESWFDGSRCIVLDYSETSIIADRKRDEIRCVAPNVYLGLAYWQKTRVLYFTLEF